MKRLLALLVILVMGITGSAGCAQTSRAESPEDPILREAVVLDALGQTWPDALRTLGLADEGTAGVLSLPTNSDVQTPYMDVTIDGEQWELSLSPIDDRLGSVTLIRSLKDDDALRDVYDRAVEVHGTPETYPHQTGRLETAVAAEDALEASAGDAWILGIRAVGNQDLNLRYTLSASRFDAEDDITVRRLYALRQNLNP